MEFEPIPLGPEQGTVEFVPFGDELQLPERFAARLTGDDLPGVASIDVTIAVRDGRAVCDSITINAAPDGAVTTDALREIPMKALVNKIAIDRAYAMDLPPDHWLTNAAPGQRIFMPLSAASEAVQAAAERTLSSRRRRITPEFLAEVAEVYRGALDTGAPTVAVKDHFNVSHSTAARYVDKARKGGLLGGAKQGHAGEIENEEAQR